MDSWRTKHLSLLGLATHLLGIAKVHIVIRSGDHGEPIVLGEGVSTTGNRIVRLNGSTKTHIPHHSRVMGSQLFPPVILDIRVVITGSGKLSEVECLGKGIHFGP